MTRNKTGSNSEKYVTLNFQLLRHCVSLREHNFLDMALFLTCLATHMKFTFFSYLIAFKDVRAKNFYNTDFFHTLATVI